MARWRGLAVAVAVSLAGLGGCDDDDGGGNGGVADADVGGLDAADGTDTGGADTGGGDAAPLPDGGPLEDSAGRTDVNLDAGVDPDGGDPDAAGDTDLPDGGGLPDAADALDTADGDAGGAPDADTAGGDIVIPPGGCTVEQECDPQEGSCWSPGQKLPCGICMNPEPEEVCETDADCKAAGDHFICEWRIEACLCGGETLCWPGCLSNADCGQGEVCLPDSHCGPAPCQTKADCPANFECTPNGCIRQVCANSNDCDDLCVNGMCYSTPGFCSQPPP